jgi:membrane-bound serine protease (ClpP class)
MTLPTPFLHRTFPGWRSLWRVFVLLVLAFVAIAPVGARQSGDSPVVVIPIHGTIEPGIGHFLERAIGEAEDLDAQAIVLDLNTPGGRLDTVLEMRDAIMDTDIRVIAYVDREAFSAGALLTIASDDIWMAPGSVFGAATPIDGATGETASEKTISAVRSVFRATAEENGRDPAIAEAMVDPAVEIEGLDTSLTLLTLSADQAMANGYAEGTAPTMDAVLGEVGLGDAPVTELGMNLWERAVRVVTDPIVASLLILLGMALIVVDGFVGGFGVVAAIGVGMLGLFYWGHLLAGLAGWEDLVLIAVGLLLLGLEIFVIPGFGVAGIAGLTALIGGLVLAMTRRDFGDEGFAAEAGDVLTSLLITLMATLVVIGVLSWLLPRLVPQTARPARGLQRMTLSATVNEGGGRARSGGWLARAFGGDERVTRDDRGHTAMEEEQLKRERRDAGS